MPRPILSAACLFVLAGCDGTSSTWLVAQAQAQAKEAKLPDFSYVTRLSPLDHVNSEGEELETLAQVLRQDRFRFHEGLGDPEDQKEAVLGNKAARLQFEAVAAAAKLDEALFRRNPKVKVEVRANKLTVTVLDQGTDDVACILKDGMLNQVQWNAPAERISVMPRWQSRGWKTQQTTGAVDLQRPDGSKVATFQHPADGPTALTLAGPTCSTLAGVRIGATLAEAKLDPLVKQSVCNCQDGNNVILWASPSSFAYQYRIDATCKKPVKCVPSDTDVMCPSAMGRKDCVITAISVAEPAG